MTPQEIFNKVVTGLASRGFARSVMRPGSIRCAYRGVDGAKCAAGELIPDAEYNSAMEEGNVFHAANYSPTLKALVNAYPALILGLQRAHDAADSPKLMKEKLRMVAKNHQLETPEVLA